MLHNKSVAASFVAARRAARVLDRYPGDRPDSLVEAYAIQRHARDLMGEPVVGWKVGRIPPPADARLGANRLAGPVFGSTVRLADERPAMPVFEGGFAAAEAEYLLRIGRAPDPSRSRYDLDDAIALIDAVHVGIEIASSPYPGINADGPAVTVSDFGNNHGLVVGPPVDAWQDRAFEGWAVALLVDGAVAGCARADAMLDGPFGAARFLFELAAEQGLSLRAGQWISSGAVTGVHVVRPGARVAARFGDRMSIGCTIVPAAPAVPG